MNRLEDFFRDPQEPERTDDFIEIQAHYNCFAVFDRARRLEEKKDRRPWEDGDC